MRRWLLPSIAFLLLTLAAWWWRSREAAELVVELSVAAPAVDAAVSVDAAIAADAVIAVDAAVDAPQVVALDLGDVKARLETCGHGTEAALAAKIGALTRAEPIGRRPAREAAHIFGATGRAYAFFEGDCGIVPVERAAAVAHGRFGGGATVAYGLVIPDCYLPSCFAAVSLKTADDRLVDAMLVLSRHTRCYQLELDRVQLFPDRDSLRVGCWSSAGADAGRGDAFLDHDGSRLASLIEGGGGIAWVQPPTDSQYCTARPPGYLAVLSVAEAPVIDVVNRSSPEEADEVGFTSPGSCAAAITARRHIFDPASRRFVPTGKPGISVVRDLCRCRPRT